MMMLRGPSYAVRGAEPICFDSDMCCIFVLFLFLAAEMDRARLPTCGYPDLEMWEFESTYSNASHRSGYEKLYERNASMRAQWMRDA